MAWTEFVAEQSMLIGLLVVMEAAYIFLESKKGGSTVSYHEVTRLLNSDSAILLDLRDSADFNAGHITGATNMPHATVAKRHTELDKFKSKKVILADKMGQHTGAAGKTLLDNGYDVVRLQGGMAEWQAQNLPVVKA